MQLQIQQLDHDHNQDAGDDADDAGTQSVIGVTASGHAYQASQRSVQAHGYIGLAVADPGVEHGGNSSHRGSHGGGQEDGSQLRRSGCCRAVEAVPAQPQDEHAQGAQGDGMTGDGVDLDHLAGGVLDVLANTGAKEDGAYQSGDAAHHVDGAGTSVIVEAQLAQPAAAPDPMGFDGIDEQGNDCGINAVGGELGALCHSAGDDGGGGGTEDQVEHEGGSGGEALSRACDEGLEVAPQLHVGQTDQTEQGIFPHHQGVTQEGKDDGANAEVHQVLHDDVACVLRSGKACLYHGEAGLHPEDQSGADQIPKFYCHTLYNS